jgi:hypothetical protein
MAVRLTMRGPSGGIKGMGWESDQLLRIGRLDVLEVVLGSPADCNCLTLTP